MERRKPYRARSTAAPLRWCTVAGCDHIAYQKGLYWTHYNEALKQAKPAPPDGMARELAERRAREAKTGLAIEDPYA